MRRVVVTGLGTINPLGNNVNDSWDSLINSKSGLKNITTFDVSEYPCQIAGSINSKLICEDLVSPREQRKIDRFITLGLIAAHEAFLDSGFEVNENNDTGKEWGTDIRGEQLHRSLYSSLLSQARLFCLPDGWRANQRKVLETRGCIQN